MMQIFLFAPGFKSMKGMRHTFLRRVLHWWVRRDLTEGTVNDKRGIENEAEEQRQVEAEGCRMRTEKQSFIMHSHPSLSHQMRQRRSEECIDTVCECQPTDVCQRQQRRGCREDIDRLKYHRAVYSLNCSLTVDVRIHQRSFI